MHDEAFIFVRDSIAKLPHPNRVLEIGSYAVNGTVRELFIDCEYVGLDIRPGPNVDVVSDVCEYDGDPFDVIVCCETLEHCDDPLAILSDAYRLLLPSGWIIITAAGPGRIPHSKDGGELGTDELYRAIHLDDLETWLGQSEFDAEFREITFGRGDLDIYATAQRQPTI